MFDLETLTLGEVARVEEISRMSIGSIADEEKPKGRALAGSIRAGRGKTKSVIRAGKARVPYAGVTHYGWPARNIAPHPFLTDALQQEASEIYDQLDRGLMAILAKNGLTT